MDLKPVFSISRPENRESVSPLTRKTLLSFVYVSAVLLLFWRFLSSQLHYDSALIGLMAQSFLNGELFPFFFGNNYMGTLDALLAAPLLMLFGPSSLAVNFWPPVLYLASMVVLHRILAKLFDFWGVFTGLFWMALPPSYGLFFAGEARTHYGLALFFSVVLLLITIKLWQTEKWKNSLCFAWGLIAGLAFWTNFLAAEVIFPCGVFLLFTGFRKLGIKQAISFSFGALLGAFPLIIYNAQNGWPHLGLSGDLRLGPRTNISQPMSWDLFVRYCEAVIKSGLPVMLGVLSPHKWSVKAGDFNFWLYLILLIAVIWACLGLLLRSLDSKQRIFWLPVAVFIGAVMAVVCTHYGSQVLQARPRYLLWVLFALPFCWAFWGGFLARRFAPWVTLVLALALGISNASGYMEFKGLWGNPLLDTKGGYFFQKEKQAKDFLAKIREKGILHIYADEQRANPFKAHEFEGAYELAFLANGKPLVADFFQDKRPHIASKVDACYDPAFLWKKQKDQIGFLGLDHKVIDNQIYWDFKEPQNVERLLDPKGWEMTTLDGRKLHDHLWDSNFRTLYVTANNQTGGDGFILDMGKEQEVAGFSLIPTVFWEVPRNARVEVAGNDKVYRLLREVRHYQIPFFLSGPRPFFKQRYARIECYFPVQKIRYMRFTHLGGNKTPWSVHEMLVYGPGKNENQLSWEKSMALALKEIKKAGIVRLYADAWPSAKADLALGDKVWTLPTNRFTNVFGDSHPRWDRPLMVDCSKGTGVLVLKREAEIVEEVFFNSGVTYNRIPAGRFVLFVLEGQQVHKDRLSIASVHSPVDTEAAGALAFGVPPSGRWGSQQTQRPGIYLELDMGESLYMGWVKLHNPKFHADFPRSLRALVSDDRKNWQETPIDLAGPIAFSGQVVYMAQGPSSLYRLKKPVKARYLRLELNEEHPVWWWSVERVEAFGPNEHQFAEAKIQPKNKGL